MLSEKSQIFPYGLDHSAFDGIDVDFAVGSTPVATHVEPEGH